MDTKYINGIVNSILRNYPALPIKIEDIAKDRGIKVVAYPLGDDVSGLLAIQNGIATIGYNATEPRTRRRFTIAHELGHYELHKEKSDLFVDKQFIYRSEHSNTTVENQKMEKEANYFASAILMPSDLLKKKLDTMRIDLGSEDGIKELAKTFEVSTTAMLVRIGSLGLL